MEGRFGAPPGGGTSAPDAGNQSRWNRNASEAEASGVANMKIALESVKKSGDSGSEYNAVLRRMNTINTLWRDVTDQASFALYRGALVSTYTALIGACNIYLEAHKGFRWSTVGRHRVRKITEIAQFAAERKQAIEAAEISVSAAPVEEIVEPPAEAPVEEIVEPSAETPAETTVEEAEEPAEEAPTPAEAMEQTAEEPAAAEEAEQTTEALAPAEEAEQTTETPAPAEETQPEQPAEKPPIPEEPWRAAYLRTGEFGGNKRGKWFLAHLEGAVRLEMGDNFRSHGRDQFISDLEVFNTRLSDLRDKCKIFLEEKKSGNSILQSSAFLEKAQDEMFRSIVSKGDAIKAGYNANNNADKAAKDLNDAFGAVKENHKAEIDTYERRRKELISGDDMSLAEGAVDENQTVLGYLHNTELSDEAFGKKAERYRKNVAAHLDTARRAFVERFISPKARESALGRFVNFMGGDILKGSRAEAEVNAVEIARLAHVKAREAVDLESGFRSDMREAKFKEAWLPLLYEDYGELKKEERDNADLKAMMLDIIQNPQERITALPAAPDSAASRRAPKTRRDTFAEFCSWDGFAGILKGYESNVRDAVSSALSDGRLKLKIKSVKQEGSEDKVIHAKSIEDLNSLSPSRLAEAYAPLRANILTNISEWESISDETLKKQMIPDLVLCQKLEEKEGEEEKDEEKKKKKDFMAMLTAKRADTEARAREDKIRFEASLMAPESEKRELHRHVLYYNYTNATSNTGVKKEARDTVRLDRLRAGAGLREQLSDGDYTAIRNIFLLVYRAAHEAPADKSKGSYEDKIDKYLHDNLKDKLKPTVERLKKLKPEPKELIAKLESTSGVMELLLSEFAPEAVEGGGQFSASFTSEDHTSYVRKLSTATHRAMIRKKELDDALVTAKGLPEERKQLFRANMRDMLVNLAPVSPELFMSPDETAKSDSSKSANQDRFGAASWGDALMKLRVMISTETNADAATAENKDMHENSKLAAKLMAARLESLKQKTTADGESIFEYALPLLRKRPATSRILMFGSEGEFEALEARLTIPMTLIAGQYSTISLIARQMVLRHFDEMAGDPKSASDWSGIFKRTSAEINEHEAVTSIDNMFRKLLDQKNTQNMMRHFPVILEASGGDFGKLADKNGLKEYQERYGKNIKVFNDFWNLNAVRATEASKSAVSADRKGFEKFVERYMFMLDGKADPKKKAQAEPQTDSAYDHGGLLKQYRQIDPGKPAFFDEDFLNYMYTAYSQERASSLQALATAQQVMNRRRAKREEFDERRAAGAKETAGDDAVTQRLREDRYAGLSPLMAGMLERETVKHKKEKDKAKKRTERMNGLRDAMKTSDVKDTSDSLRETAFKPEEGQAAISDAVRGSVLERRIMGADSDDSMSKASATKLTALEARLRDIEFAGPARRLSRAEAEDFMPYVQVFGKAWEKEAPADQTAYDNELQTLYKSYSKCREAAAQLEKMEIAGVTLAAERDEAVRDLHYGVYVLSRTVFTKLAENKTRFFTNALKCEPMFVAEVGKYSAPVERSAKNLREYFASELQKDGLDPETLREPVQTLLKDAGMRDYISGVAAKEPLSAETFKELSGDVAFDALEDYELTPRGADDRRTFEQLLRNNKRVIVDNTIDDSYWNQYSKLESDEKRLLALALTLPGVSRDVPEMPNANVGAGAEGKATARGRSADVTAYVEGGEFKPRVDYSYAIHTLTDREGKVKSEVFDNAYEFTKLCHWQRAENQGATLSHLLSDPDATLSYNKYFEDKDRDKEIGSFANLIEALRASSALYKDGLGDEDSGALEAISYIDEFAGKPPGNLLIAALQDRTMLDYTTKMSVWDRKDGEYHPFVNEGGRGSLLDDYVKNGVAAVPMSGDIKSAYLVLHSYQVRDDADLKNARAVRKGELAKGALKRRSATDWKLLSRAIDFVKEAEEERLRILSLGNLVSSENETAKLMFDQATKMEADQVDEATLDGRIITYAKQDKKLPELAGYLSLGAQEKKLFIKALGRRAALDISKRGIMLNRFGLGGRAYANEGAREDLTDDFVNNGAVTLDGDDCKNALRACFSAQIDDSAKIEESGEGKEERLSTSSRTTAIDWKLFGRALQFVRRTSDERKMFLEDRTLYNTSGDVANEGEFKYSSGNLRRNVHDAGNRFTRYLGRRVASRVMDKIPGPILMVVRAVLPINYANELAKLDFMAPEEEGNENWPDKVKSAVDDAQQYTEIAVNAGEFVGNAAKATKTHAGDSVHSAMTVISDKFGGTYSDVTEHLGNIGTAYDAMRQLYEAGKTINDNRKTNNEAKEAAARDSLKLALSSAERIQLSATEEEQLENAIKRNKKAASRGQGMATNRKVDEIVNATAELLGSIAEGAAEGTGLSELPIAAIVEEAGHFINFVRGYFEDKKNIAQYFDSQSEAEKLKNKLKTTDGLQLSPEDLKSIEDYGDNEMMRRGMGYENYTEMASVVGLSVTRSLLFSAGKQGSLEENRVRAIAVLVMLDCEELMGKHDAESAEKLYSAIMASDYR
ncbi:MAG: hypothetical protein LBJ84_01960 [Oscillospiraceae bacterium]|jgi:hypothetical protein|nr:hypothetical protein [Oscillospiraceae bacterium]